MIERLINQELPYGEPEYSRSATQAEALMELLRTQLDLEGKTKLEELADIFAHQGNIVSQDMFVEGFCTALDMMAEYIRRRSS